MPLRRALIVQTFVPAGNTHTELTRHHTLQKACLLTFYSLQSYYYTAVRIPLSFERPSTLVVADEASDQHHKRHRADDSADRLASSS